VSEALVQSTAFKRFANCAAELQAVRLDTLPKSEMKAFFLNLHNAFVIHAVIVQVRSAEAAH
jgi:hypothetical protein